MISRKKLQLTILGILLACSAGLLTTFGQEDMRNLEFRVFSLNRDVIEGLYYQAGPEEFRPLSFRSRRRSELHEYRGPPVITFFRKAANTEPSESPYAPVSAINIPNGAKEPLFFFLPLNASDSNGETEYRILAMDDSPGSFPYGYLRILNASGAPLSGRVGDEDIKLGFEVSPAWPSRSLFSRDGSWVNLALFLQVRDDLEMVYANQLTFASDARSILVIRPPRRENSLKVTTFILEDYEAKEDPNELGSQP